MLNWDNWTEKQRRDWIRSTHNLPPAKLDWQDKLVIGGSLGAIVFFILLLLAGGV